MAIDDRQRVSDATNVASVHRLRYVTTYHQTGHYSAFVILYNLIIKIVESNKAHG